MPTSAPHSLRAIVVTAIHHVYNHPTSCHRINLFMVYLTAISAPILQFPSRCSQVFLHPRLCGFLWGCAAGEGTLTTEAICLHFRGLHIPCFRFNCMLFILWSCVSCWACASTNKKQHPAAKSFLRTWWLFDKSRKSPYFMSLQIWKYFCKGRQLVNSIHVLTSHFWKRIFIFSFHLHFCISGSQFPSGSQP